MIDYDKISDNYDVIELIKKRQEIERKINQIDTQALLKYELILISMPDSEFDKLNGIYR